MNDRIAADFDRAVKLARRVKRTRPELTEKVRGLLHALTQSPHLQPVLADAMEEDGLVDHTNPAAMRTLESLRSGDGKRRYLHPTQYGWAALDHPPLSLRDIQDSSLGSGFSYFRPDTMRSFRSRPSNKIYQGPGGVYFVDSTSHLGNRDYTVQRFIPETGEITSFLHPGGKYYQEVPYKELQHLDQRFDNSRDAHQLAAHLAEHGRLPETQ